MTATPCLKQVIGAFISVGQDWMSRPDGVTPQDLAVTLMISCVLNFALVYALAMTEQRFKSSLAAAKSAGGSSSGTSKQQLMQAVNMQQRRSVVQQQASRAGPTSSFTHDGFVDGDGV